MFFLYECSGLTEIDLSPLSKVTQIGQEFLSECEKLKKIKIIQPQQEILLKNNKKFKSKLDIDNSWYNSFEGQKLVRKNIQQSNNIQDSDILLNIIDYI